MNIVEGNYLVLILCSLLVAGCTIDALSYDYSASIECLKEPLKPQYGGGIIDNPEFNNGLEAWSTYGDAKTITRSKDGNSFMVAHSRNTPHGSFSQKIYMDKDHLYTFSAWIQLSEGKEPVSAVFKTGDGFTHAGSTIAKSGCWSMLKGGLTVEKSGNAELYFESNNTKVEIWVDNVSLQPFTQEEWTSHQTESIEKVHKRKVEIQAIDANGKILEGARILIRQNSASFPFGSSITKDILTNTAYQKWFKERFSVTVFANEMKWYSTENTPGKEDYSVPDAMMKFAQQNGIAVRGHNIFWDDPKYQPWWIKSLSGAKLQDAVYRRINSVASRYAGQLISWDVNNENMHWTFFEDKLGANFSAAIFQKAHQLDPKAIMFLNEYNTIERSNEATAGPARYLEKLEQIRSFPGNTVPLGIGLESHFTKVNIPYMRATLDTLASAKVPIWLTEVDVESSGDQEAKKLEQILKEARSHPAVEGIMLWAAWQQSGCWRMCLTDSNFNNLPTGYAVDKLVNIWRRAKLVGKTDHNGYFEASLFHGDYDVIITHPSVNSSTTKSFQVTATKTSEETKLHVQVVA